MQTSLLLWLWACGGVEPGAPVGAVDAEPEVQALDLANLPRWDVLDGPSLRLMPATNELPANVHQVVVDFGQPMSLTRPEVGVYRPDGIEVAGALDKVRWDGPIERATLVLEPLEVGAEYVLVVGGMASADGTPVPRFQHRFRVFPADEQAPSGDGLFLEGTPTAGSMAALKIRFPEPMGEPTLQAVSLMLDGEPADGDWSLEEGGLVLRFTPGAPWPEDARVFAGVSAAAVDVAGNELVEVPAHMLQPVKRLAQ